MDAPKELITRMEQEIQTMKREAEASRKRWRLAIDTRRNQLAELQQQRSGK